MRMLFAGLFAALTLVVSANAQAQQDWWFDIEVILFDRGQSVEGLQEEFERAPALGTVSANWDLLGALFQPDIGLLKQTLPACDTPTSPVWVEKTSLPKITGYRPTFDLADFEPEENDELTQSQASATSDSSFDQLTSTEQEKSLTPSEIARLWLAFHGPDSTAIEIPETRYCEPSQPWISWQNNQWHVHQPDNSLPFPDHIPIEPQGYDEFDGTAHILSSQSNELTKLSQQIRQTRGLTRLLHLTWRQPVVFGQDKAPSVRIFAGKDYSKQFTHSGTARAEVLQTSGSRQPNKDPEADVSSADSWSVLQARLNRPEPVPFEQMMSARTDAGVTNQANTLSSLQNEQQQGPIWQMDGYLKVYLKNINQVPYLHIDSRLFYRQPVPLAASDATQPEYELVAVPFHQVRRVISKQLHYFDHPLFGMVVKIRRFKVPEGI